jgi:tetratricopeptide (TPR) repeat protein
LTEQATRLTPACRSELARERMVHAADYHFRAGDITRSQELIESALPACPAASLRALLLLRLATIYYHQSGWPLAEQTFRQAAKEALDDPALYAYAEQELAFARLVAGDLPGASRLAQESLRSAEQTADPRLMAHSLARVAVFEFLQGHGARLDLLDRAEALDAAASAEPLARLPRSTRPWSGDWCSKRWQRRRAAWSRSFRTYLAEYLTLTRHESADPDFGRPSFRQGTGNW